MRFRTASGLTLALLALGFSSPADSNIDFAAPYAWSESGGWINMRGDTTNGVVVSGASVSGFAWSECCGWINLGDGSNTDPAAFGIINDGAGNLSGFAWGEAIGWIDFDTLSSGGSRVAIGSDGQFSGYAWSESLGWINMNSGYGVVTAAGGEGEGDTETEASQVILVTFNALDDNDDGSIVSDTASVFLQEILGYDSIEADALVALLDANSDGFLRLNELRQFTGARAAVHAADTSGNGQVGLTELLRLIQFFNSAGFRCAAAQQNSLDGYVPGTAGSTACTPHDSDFNPQNFSISLQELLRLIQFFNSGGYFACNTGTLDGYCPGQPE